MDQQDRDDWQKFRRGDRIGLQRIYNRHKNKLYSFCFYVTGNREMSEDIVQETFVQLMNQKAKLRIKTALKNWLFICTRNLVYNRLKKNNKQILPLSQITNPTVAMDIETKLFINNVLDKLSLDERELILLREQQQFTTEEISDMLGISEEAVRVRLYRVRKKMQQIAKEQI
ncbi:MAG: RNA polymerase sigma factor [Candidatus Zixiibacteriota bacterium]